MNLLPDLFWIRLENVSIYDQLILEERLLRTDNRNFCLVNFGSPQAIVMGISGEPNELLDIEIVRSRKIPVIKRFSGGGTVIVNEQTLFISLIMEKTSVDIPSYPEPILRWTADLYQAAWQIPNFALQENDYCIGLKKCGGNAQYMRKERWLHHTSFLWDYRAEEMKALLMPAKQPSYRKNREHKEFLCRLNEHGHSPEGRITQVKTELSKRYFLKEHDPFLEKNIAAYRQTTTLCQI